MKFTNLGYLISFYKATSGHILVNLLIVHGGGWITLPAIVILAHFFKLDASPIFIAIIFIGIINAPFGLLLNEGLAVSNARNGNLNVISGISLVITFQFLSLGFLWALELESLKINSYDYFLLIIFCSLGSLLSYIATNKIYSLIIMKNINKKLLSVISISPGISNLLIYFLFFYLGSNFEKVLFFTFLLPSIIQLLLVYFFSNHPKNLFLKSILINEKYENKIKVRNKDVILTLGYIVILSIFTASYRDKLVSINFDYAAIILVGVNAISSIFSLIVKYNFMREKVSIFIKPNLIILIVLLIGLINLLFLNSIILIITLCLLSAFVVIKINHFRIFTLKNN